MAEYQPRHCHSAHAATPGVGSSRTITSLITLSHRRFKAINGLLLPGGGANLSPGHPFYDAAATLVNMALDANDRGDYFPVRTRVTAACAVLHVPAARSLSTAPETSTTPPPRLMESLGVFTTLPVSASLLNVSTLPSTSCSVHKSLVAKVHMHMCAVTVKVWSV